MGTLGDCSMATNKILVLDKALSILSFFYINSELSVKELEKLTGVNRTTIFKSLQSFVDWGYLEQDPVSKRYKASIKILGMAGTLLQRMDVIKIARPYLISLRDETEESTIVTILNDFDVLIADWEPSFHDAHINSFIGKKVPAYCTGAGKAILSYLSLNEVEILLNKHELKKCTKNTITNKKKFLLELNKTSSRGFGVSIEEFGPDVIAVAAPIFNINNVVIASIAVAALKSRIKDENKIDKLGKSVIKSASGISKELGSTFYK